MRRTARSCSLCACSTPRPSPSLHELETFEEAVQDFQDPSQEWRRLFSELLGTFFLVLVAAGGGMMGQAFPGTISRTAAVVAPGLMVMAIILFMGKVSGAHLNPAVSIAFALRRDFPWWRVPGYIVVQLGGAALAAWFLQAVVHVSATYGSNYPAAGFSNSDAFFMEMVLTFGLVSVILGTASGAQNLGDHRRVGRRRVHRARRLVGQPDLRRVDEPGAHVRPRRRRRRLPRLLGLRRRPAGGRRRRGRHRVRATRSGRRARRIGRRPGRARTPRSRTPTRRSPGRISPRRAPRPRPPANVRRDPACRPRPPRARS